MSTFPLRSSLVAVVATLVVGACGGASAPTQPSQPAPVATKLAFQVQPGQTAAGQSISPALQVAIEDAAGNPVPGATSAVTVALSASPAGGTLSGTRTVNAVNGIAAFAGLSIDKAGAGYQLSASSGTLTAATSTTFAVVAAAAAQLLFTAVAVMGGLTFAAVSAGASHVCGLTTA